MGKFWILLTIAFVDLAAAGALAGRGHGSIAFLFLLMAAVMGAYAFYSTPSTTRVTRGRLQPTEPRYGAVLGIVGALVILGSAAYVAVVSTRPAAHVPEPVSAKPTPARTAPAPAPAAYAPPRSYSPHATDAALYKCVDSRGHASYQSMPCPEESEQAWVRDATPEPEPTAAQRRRLAVRESAARESAGSAGYVYMPDSRAEASGSGSSAACAAAREADAAYRRQPLRLVTHDGLRRHGDRVRDACR